MPSGRCCPASAVCRDDAHLCVALLRASGVPRSSLVRIATGGDAANTAFMAVVSGHTDLIDVVVGAVAGALPDDDMMAATQLG